MTVVLMLLARNISGSMMYIFIRMYQCIYSNLVCFGQVSLPDGLVDFQIYSSMEGLKFSRFDHFHTPANILLLSEIFNIYLTKSWDYPCSKHSQTSVYSMCLSLEKGRKPIYGKMNPLFSYNVFKSLLVRSLTVEIICKGLFLYHKLGTFKPFPNKKL